MNKTRTLAGLACLGLTGFASAALVSPVSVALGDSAINGGTTFLEAVNAGHGQENWYDETGITSTIVGGYFTHEPYSGSNGSRIRNANASGGVHAGSIDFTLAAPTTLDGWVLWNGNEDDHRNDFTRTEAQRDKTGRGIEEAELFTSTDGTIFISQGTFNFAQEVYTHSTTGSSVGDSNGQFNSFTEVANVNHVRLNVLNHGGGNIMNFNEVAFNQVPEPSTSLLGALGLGLLVIRRRR